MEYPEVPCRSAISCDYWIEDRDRINEEIEHIKFNLPLYRRAEGFTIADIVDLLGRIDTSKWQHFNGRRCGVIYPCDKVWVIESVLAKLDSVHLGLCLKCVRRGSDEAGACSRH